MVSYVVDITNLYGEPMKEQIKAYRKCRMDTIKIVCCRSQKQHQWHGSGLHFDHIQCWSTLWSYPMQIKAITKINYESISWQMSSITCHLQFVRSRCLNQFITDTLKRGVLLSYPILRQFPILEWWEITLYIQCDNWYGNHFWWIMFQTICTKSIKISNLIYS